MLPIIVVPTKAKVALLGEGERAARREAMLRDAGITYFARPGARASKVELQDIDILFVAGLDESRSREVATAARAQGVLVNVEDVPELCDFHVPAMIRRGDLLFTVSSGGKSPGLSAVLREEIETIFGPDWETYVEELASARADWRRSGLDARQVAHKTRQLVSDRGWIVREARR
jgi:precorrin-2 dehydrogenase/sirohydrochlorin ferrochelatase